jgi:hypothetical protein
VSPTQPRRETVLLVVVGAHGGVAAMVREHSPPAYSDGHVDLTTYGTLEQLLTRTAYALPNGQQVHVAVPADTPVVRFDLVAWETAAAFSYGGPIRCPRLPAGTIHRLGEAPRPYQQQPWAEVGAYATVSLDVYLHLADQAGIPVQRAAEHTGDQLEQPTAAESAPDLTPSDGPAADA